MSDREKGFHIDDIKFFQATAWRRLFASLDSNPQAFILFDEKLKILALNKRAEEFFSGALSYLQSIDKPFLDGFPQTAHAQLLDAIQPALDGNISHLDYEFSTSRGQASYSMVFSPLLPMDGPVTGILCSVTAKMENEPGGIGPSLIFTGPGAQRDPHATALEEINRQLRQDIEQHLEIESNLQANELFFRQSFHGLPDPILIWLKDSEGEIRLAMANQAAADLIGSRVQDLTGLTLDDFYAHALPFISLVQNAFTDGDTRQVELRFTSNLTEDEKWVLCDFIRLSEQHVMNILRDISREKDRQRIDEDTRNQIELLRLAMTAFTSVLNIDQVLKNVLEYLEKLIPNDRVILFLLEGADLQVRATRGFPREDDPVDLMLPAQNPQFEAINRNRLPLFLTNARDYRPFESLGALNCGKSWLGVPLLSHGQILGYLSIYAAEAGLYDSSHTRLAEIFANEASIAIENARLFQQVQQLAVTDELSGFYNRRYFYELLDMELARSKRYNRPVSLLVIDLDHFKQVNDRYGHATGDQVLKKICEAIRRVVRESDILGRHGGEEFVLLLPETPVDRALEVADRLCHMVAANPVEVDQIRIDVTISIGVSAAGPGCMDSDSLFRCADHAMYQSKQAGRNQASVFSEPTGK